MRAIDRFMRHTRVDPDSGCLVWIGYLTKNGYGRFGCEGVMYMAHRWLFQRANFIPSTTESDLVLDHLCRNRACVRPTHLELVTRLENTRRSPLSAKGVFRRTHCPQGHPYDAENTYWHRGHRHCRTCSRARVKQTPRELRAMYARNFRRRQRAGKLARRIYDELNSELIAAGITPANTGPPRITRQNYGRSWIVETAA